MRPTAIGTHQAESEDSEKGRRDRRRWLWLAILALLIAQGGCFVVLPMAADAGSRSMLPVSLRALGEADYSVDPLGTSQPQLQFAIVGDVLRDVEPEATDIESRITALEESMQTPIATDGEPTEVVASTLTPTETPTTAPSSTATPIGTASPDATSTLGPSPTPTATLTASATVTASASPTGTQAPSQTPSASPTPTIPPPTATPTASKTPEPTSSCDDIQFVGFSAGGDNVAWHIQNNYGIKIQISEIFYGWPEDNDGLEQIELDGWDVWNQGADESPVTITADEMTNFDRTIRNTDTEELEFTHNDSVSTNQSSYSLNVKFENGCSISP